MVYYRKYRPQKIKELDSEEIREKLHSLFSGGSSVPHAFLFTGPKGLGKTSTARIVAKILNCEKLNKESGIKNKGKKKTSKKHNSSFIIPNSQGIEPCNKCLQCVSIANGTNLDVLEIDGASNRGIDEIRDLREKIRLSPVAASKKVYIIDEVHMLTTEAFNALLKTLEEPPSHAVFILCTTEPQKVPATIVSRCFHIPFRLATKDELLRSFSRIAKEEKVPIEKEVLLYLASLSDGSFRDGVKILEELVLVSHKKKITKELVEEKYKISNIRYQISKMVELLAERNVKEALGLVSKIVKEGIDIKYFIGEMISELHSMLLAEVGVGENMKMENRGLKIEEVMRLIDLLAKAYGEIKFAVLSQLPLELAIVEWGMGTDGAEVVGLVGDSPTLATELPLPSAGSNIHSSRSSKSPPISYLTSPASGSPQPNIFDKRDIFATLIEQVKPLNHSVAGVLRGCTLKSFDGKNLAIETGYKFHKERLEERKTRDILEKVCEEITGEPISVSVVLKEK